MAYKRGWPLTHFFISIQQLLPLIPRRHSPSLAIKNSQVLRANYPEKEYLQVNDKPSLLTERAAP